VLPEGFRDSAAGVAHVNSAHFKTAIGEMRDWVASIPKIINVEVPGEEWSELVEIRPNE
jgi:quinol monooxygenase YgiN